MNWFIFHGVRKYQCLLDAKNQKFCCSFMYLINVSSTINLLQALCHVTPLRDYFLREINYARVKRPPGDSSFLLVQRFGELMRKLWNPRNFKAHVSPHEMLQAVVLWSRKKFQFTKQGDLINNGY